MEFRTVGKPKHGRRSKLDIVGDILQVISDGSERPTNIMFRANLTWPLTITYLEALLRHKMVTREAMGATNKFAYKIAPKGAALLRSYTDVEEAAAELELDRMDYKLLSKATAKKSRTPKVEPLLGSIRESMLKQGYAVSPNNLQGRSGAEHTFDLVMTKGEVSKICFLGIDRATQWDVIRAFVIMSDCDAQVQIASKDPPTADAWELADAYKLKLIVSPKA